MYLNYRELLGSAWNLPFVTCVPRPRGEEGSNYLAEESYTQKTAMEMTLSPQVSSYCEKMSVVLSLRTKAQLSVQIASTGEF